MTLLFRAVAAAAIGLLLLSQSAQAAEKTPDVSLEKEVDSYLEEAQSGSAAPNSVTWTVSKGIKWKSADGNFSGQIGGRLMIDWKWISGDEQDGFDSEFTGDGVFPRRLRMFIAGTIYKNVGFKIQFDFTNGGEEGPKPQDVWISLKKIFLNGTLKMGHFKEPFALEEVTSSKYISFIERSIVTNAFAPGYNVGLAFFHVLTDDKRIALQYGIFRETDAYMEQMEDGGYNLTVRIAGWFWEDDEINRVVHVGFAFSFRDPSSEDFRNRARIGVGKGDRPFDTGTYAADEVVVFGFELAVTYRAFHFAAEFMASESSAPSGGEDFSFSGFYVEAGYWITGEPKNYSKKKFAFDRNKVNNNFHDGKDGGYGAIQILVRFETLDLNDGSILGGDGTVFLIGVNWHWNPNTRVMFNVVFGDIDNGDDNAYNGDVTLLVIRWQLDF